MKAAIVTEAGRTPTFGEFKEPVAGVGEVLIKVTASALSNLVRARAAGTHYSSAGTFPFVVGVDGVGRLEDGRRVYFVLPSSPFGSMSERTVVKSTQCVSVPDELDDATAAAIANPGMSAWAALKERAKLVAGETVLVNGATGTAGRLAIQIAKYLGAKKVIATGRNREALNSLARLGADVTVPLIEDLDALEATFRQEFTAGVDVVLDYLWGASAERLLIAGARSGRPATPIRFVQIGSISGENISLPGAALRSSAIELMGSGIGSVPLERLVQSIEELMNATVPGGFEIAIKTEPLSAIESVWANEKTIPRTVFLVS